MVQNNAKLITHMVSPHLLRSNWKNNCKKCKSDRTYSWFVHLKPFCQTSKLEFWNCSKLQQRHLWNERLLRKGWYMWIMCFLFWFQGGAQLYSAQFGAISQFSWSLVLKDFNLNLFLFRQITQPQPQHLANYLYCQTLTQYPA